MSCAGLEAGGALQVCPAPSELLFCSGGTKGDVGVLSVCIEATGLNNGRFSRMYFNDPLFLGRGERQKREVWKSFSEILLQYLIADKDLITRASRPSGRVSVEVPSYSSFEER